MQRQTIMKMTVAIALLFAVNMNADAQIGKLLKKAKETVTEKVGSVISTDNPVSDVLGESSGVPGAPIGESNANQKRDRQWFKENSTAEGYEHFCIEEDGGLQQYLGMTEGDEALIWKYYDKYSSKNYVSPSQSTREIGKTAGNRLAECIVSIKRMIKIADYKVDKKIALRDMTVDHYTISQFYYDFPTEDWKGRHMSPAGKDWRLKDCKVLNGGHYDKKVITKVVPMNDADYATFERVLAKVKQEYEAIYGPIPQP